MAIADDGALGTLVHQVKKQVEAGEAVSLELIQSLAGQRSAGPMLLLPALVAISPLSIIPGLPTLVGINTILVAGQVAFGHETIWLPKWLKERELPAKHARKLLKFLGPASEVADGVAKQRASWITGPLMRRMGAGVCVLMGMIMPFLEFIPFATTWASSTVAVYALAITARDGLLAVAWGGLVLAVISTALAFLL